MGSWRAKAGNATIDLAITDDSQFVWKAVQAGKPAAELKGQIASTSDELVLESADQGSMTGSVKSLGPDKWRFAALSSTTTATDPGLSFDRVRK